MNAGAAAAAHAALASDTDLVRAVRMYGDEAFEELYRRYREPIARFVGSLIQDDGRAEDVAQEAFVSALRRIRQTDCEIRFKPWIYEIARNAAIDHHRRSSRAEEVPFGPDAGPTVAASTPCAAPEASFLEKERLDHLRGALDELSGASSSCASSRASPTERSGSGCSSARRPWRVPCFARAASSSTSTSRSTPAGDAR